VLVIDDNVDFADSLRRVIEMIGAHVVEVAYSGGEGVKKARAFKPDIIFCDIGLPEMNGYALARALRADPDLAHVALVALTGYGLPDDLAKAREAGFDAHVVKPPDVNAVLEQIETLPDRLLRARPKLPGATRGRPGRSKK
jgi:two-component system CheB/CheR fusion protein